VQGQPPAVTDLERGGGFYALLFVVFWVGIGMAWLLRHSMRLVKEQADANKAANEKYIEMMSQQITRGQEQTKEMIAAFERSLDIHEAQARAAQPPGKRRP